MGDERDESLPLTAVQRRELAALQALLRRSQRDEDGLGTRDGGLGGTGLRDVAGWLPPCPLGAPPRPITHQFDPASGNLYLRCLHTPVDPGPHFWDLNGKRLDGPA